MEYPNGAPSEMLFNNPDIDEIVDWARPLPQFDHRVVLRYAWFGGPSLDYPIQAHYWENLGLAWAFGQRFDAVYNVTDDEMAWAEHRLAIEGHGPPYLVVTPHTGWPGKGWTKDGWAGVIEWARNKAVTPVVLAGHRLSGSPWDGRGVLNLSGQLNVRRTGAVLALADSAVMIEGMLSNLRLAVGRRVVLLTCATQAGVQIWTPPELTTEVRMVAGRRGRPKPGVPGVRDGIPACEPCMWRRGHQKSRDANIPPASIVHCPAGRSLRDIASKDVITLLDLK